MSVTRLCLLQVAPAEFPWCEYDLPNGNFYLPLSGGGFVPDWAGWTVMLGWAVELHADWLRSWFFGRNEDTVMKYGIEQSWDLED